MSTCRVSFLSFLSPFSFLLSPFSFLPLPLSPLPISPLPRSSPSLLSLAPLPRPRAARTCCSSRCCQCASRWRSFSCSALSRRLRSSWARATAASIAATALWMLCCCCCTAEDSVSHTPSIAVVLGTVRSSLSSLSLSISLSLCTHWQPCDTHTHTRTHTHRLDLHSYGVVGGFSSLGVFSLATGRLLLRPLSLALRESAADCASTMSAGRDAKKKRTEHGQGAGQVRNRRLRLVRRLCSACALKSLRRIAAGACVVYLGVCTWQAYCRAIEETVERERERKRSVLFQAVFHHCTFPLALLTVDDAIFILQSVCQYRFFSALCLYPLEQ